MHAILTATALLITFATQSAAVSGSMRFTIKNIT